MTRAEAEVVFSFHLPCVFTGSSDSDLDCLKGKEFKIVQIIDFYRTEMREFSTSVCLAVNQRNYCTVALYNVECAPGYEAFVNAEIKKAKKAKLKELLTPLLDNLKTKKEIYAFIGKLIDEIKAERKA